MYRLFVNNVQIGNYRTLRDMEVAVLNMSCLKKGARSCRWSGNDLRVRTAE